MNQRSTSVAAGAPAGALPLAACGGGSDEPARAASQTVSPSPSGARSGSEQSTITVNGAEMSLELPQPNLRPGTYTFVFDNTGQVPHALAIKGPGADSATTKTVNGGERTEVTMALSEGGYELWCPVGQRRELGTATTLSVG